MAAHPHRTTPTRPQRICQLLAQQPERAWHYTEVAQHLDLPPQRVAETCHRLNHRGVLRWVTFGTYRLAGEEPQR